MKIRAFIFITILFSTANVFAEQDNRCGKNKITSENAASFPESYAAAIELSKALCEQHIKLSRGETLPDIQLSLSNRERSYEVKRKADGWKKAALEETASLKTVGIDLSTSIELIYQAYLDGLPYQYFQVNKLGRNLSYRLTVGNSTPIVDNNICKTLATGVNCFVLLKQFGAVTEAVIDLTNVAILDDAYDKIGLYNAAWTQYFTEARSQTFIELGINTWRYSDELQRGENVLPPSSQLIFLHPGIAIEYVKNAVDGQQQKQALVMEWIGMNWWDLSVPFGFSVISSYTDRTGLNDHAWGVMLHFYNNYSIAYTKRTDGNGVLVTVDLLKLFEDKKANLNRYKDKAGKYINLDAGNN